MNPSSARFVTEPSAIGGEFEQTPTRTSDGEQVDKSMRGASFDCELESANYCKPVGLGDRPWGPQLCAARFNVPGSLRDCHAVRVAKLNGEWEQVIPRAPSVHDLGLQLEIPEHRGPLGPCLDYTQLSHTHLLAHRGPWRPCVLKVRGELSVFELEFPNSSESVGLIEPCVRVHAVCQLNVLWQLTQ